MSLLDMRDDGVALSAHDVDSRFMRRAEAEQYLRNKYGFGSRHTLAKASVYGNGPAFRKAGRFVLYKAADLDAWAASKISGPLMSTSEYEAA